MLTYFFRIQIVKWNTCSWLKMRSGMCTTEASQRKVCYTVKILENNCQNGASIPKCRLLFRAPYLPVRFKQNNIYINKNVPHKAYMDDDATQK